MESKEEQNSHVEISYVICPPFLLEKDWTTTSLFELVADWLYKRNTLTVYKDKSQAQFIASQFTSIPSEYDASKHVLSKPILCIPQAIPSDAITFKKVPQVYISENNTTTINSYAVEAIAFMPYSSTEWKIIFDNLELAHPKNNALVSGLWKKQGNFIKEYPYTKDCNRLCRYINTGPGMVHEIKLTGYVNGQSGIMITFSNAQQAMDYANYLNPLNGYDRKAVLQKENIALIKERSPLYLASFLLGLNRITNYPEVVAIESLILQDLCIDLTKDTSIEPKDEPAQQATYEQLVEGILSSLVSKEGVFFENKGKRQHCRFFQGATENKEIIDIASLSPR